jgi:hypothetical protein
MDVLGLGKARVTWLHRDQREEQMQMSLMELGVEALEAAHRPQIQPIIQVCVGDKVEIAINLYSLQGMLKVDSIEWFPPHILPVSKFNALNYEMFTHNTDKF